MDHTGTIRREIRTLYLCLQHVENFNERLVQIQGWEDENIVVDEDPPTFSLFFAYCPMETQTAHFFQVYDALLDRFHPLISGARVLILNERLDASGVDDFAYTAEHEMAQRLGLVKLLSLASGNNPTFLPHLQELRIGFLDEASGFADASLKTLIGPLSARRDRGHILETLVIDSTQSRETDDPVGEETVQELSTIVGRVELQSRNVR
ncbi:hypothetical protein QCA50_007652 [Cerrena zonata]|uniref:Uncharacterized protein n=1 Tax=Cerrena zonata TaxID=2478898 RepID=A0AAW0G8B7_9APHY